MGDPAKKPTMEDLAREVVSCAALVEARIAEEREASRAESAARNALTSARNHLAAAWGAMNERTEALKGRG